MDEPIDDLARIRKRRAAEARADELATELDQRGIPLQVHTDGVVRIAGELGKAVRRSYSTRKENVVHDLLVLSQKCSEVENTRAIGAVVEAFLVGWVGNKKS